jgi:hypothetical protein
LSKKYPSLTPFQFASNSPIAGIDVDGLEFFFAAGAGNDLGKLANGYSKMLMNAFKVAGIENLIRLNAHKSQFHDIEFAIGIFAQKPYNSIPMTKEVADVGQGKLTIIKENFDEYIRIGQAVQYVQSERI